MLQKVEIHDGGESTFLVGEQVDRDEFEEVNNKVIADGGRPAVARPVLQGITNARLPTCSFIPPAPFPETNRVRTEEGAHGQEGRLIRLKGDIIRSRTIPTRTDAVGQT